MYLYLYDNFLNDNKFNKTLARIETRLTDLGIGGKISRLSPLKDLQELIKDEIRSGVKTIVVVGNDKTVIEIVNEIADYHLTLGIIPIGPKNFIAQTLGIVSVEAACNILSARKTETLDLGKVNGSYFLANLTILPQRNLPATQLKFELENRYYVVPEAKNFQVSICNLQPLFAAGSGTHVFNPQDGFLEIFIQPQFKNFSLFSLFKNQPKKDSIIPFKKIVILARQAINVIIDNFKVLKTPLEVSVVPQKLRVIVGKERKF